MSLLKMSLCVGDSFETYSELQTCIGEFERANYRELVHRDSRTLMGAMQDTCTKSGGKSQARAEVLQYWFAHLGERNTKGKTLSKVKFNLLHVS